MAYNFIECNRDQMFLMPPSLKEWLPEEDLAWFIIDAVEQMDLSEFYKKYRPDGKGGASFEPSMMVSLLLYSYCKGIRSSRQIEMLCERDVAYKVIAANQVPDHSTICRFRQENGTGVETLFTEVLRLSAKAGLLKVGIVAIDGSKMRANAALEANISYEHIREEVKKMLHEAEDIDRKEDELYGKDRRGDELPEELKDHKSRVARLKECKERLEKEAREEAEKKEEKIEARTREEGETGKKKRGRKPVPPASEPQSCGKANVTDPDSRIMKTRKGYIQGYNGQAVVTEGQIIIAAELTTEENDVKQLHPMVEKAEENIKAATGEKKEAIVTETKEQKIEGQKIRTVLADAGYISDSNLEKIPEEGPEHLIATKKDWKHRRAMREAAPPRGRIPKGLTLRERMERKLLTKRGRTLYKKRGQMIEAVFGQIKSLRGIEGFMRRGFDACAKEWKLICATHNLLKIWRSGAIAMT